MTTVRSNAMEPAMSQPHTVPPFAVISGAQVQHALQDREKQIVDLIEATYHLHAAGESVNPLPTSCASPTAPPPGSSRCPPRSAGKCGWTASNGSPASLTTSRPASPGPPQF
ncbi:hypothetical protein SAV31267_009290 [Streptomyces avermitilis]|uniref:Uncharacterized protein n=1 Tax=Streptomyces avermitilis TaxID=33903 RepID=A0A4D4MIA3_STRAX|nr:hypothetical protein SAV31267_009290 [Streptomyces avermitilis]